MKLGKMFRRTNEFRTRTPERDRETDSQNIAPVFRHIESALQTFGSELKGLEIRIAAAGLRGSFLVGNETDGYLTRDAADSNQLSQIDAEMKTGEARLDVLRHNIASLQIIREKLLEKFPACRIDLDSASVA
jgi:hypothetical protein